MAARAVSSLEEKVREASEHTMAALDQLNLQATRSSCQTVVAHEHSQVSSTMETLGAMQLSCGEEIGQATSLQDRTCGYADLMCQPNPSAWSKLRERYHVLYKLRAYGVPVHVEMNAKDLVAHIGTPLVALMQRGDIDSALIQIRKMTSTRERSWAKVGAGGVRGYGSCCLGWCR